MDYCRSVMSEDKKRRVDRFRSENDKKRTITGELLARQMIASQCRISPENITFSLTEKGKPFVPDLPVKFSISHSGEYVLCTVSDCSVGADIEKLRNVNDRLIYRVCAENEKRYVAEKGISQAEKNRRFMRVWTGKEAYFKYLGTGITALKEVDIFDDAIQRKMTCFYYDNYTVSIFVDCIPVMQDKTSFQKLKFRGQQN